MNKTRTQQQLYIVFWIIIVILIGLIGWFTYLLIQPKDSDPQTTTNTNVVTDNTNVNSGKKKKNKNTNTTETNTNAASDDTANTNAAATDADTTTDGGLVEPADGTDATTDDTDETSADADATTDDADADAEADEAGTGTDEIAADDDGKQTVTLYFPKASSGCGEVYPVERKIEPSDDLYGQIILETMHGPTDEETGYSSAVPSGMYLRRVEYTADGALITVSEAYDTLDSCDQETAAAQLIETANAMFELPEGTAGEVVVGTVSDDEDDTTDAAEDSDTDSTDTDSE